MALFRFRTPEEYYKLGQEYAAAEAAHLAGNAQEPPEPEEAILNNDHFLSGYCDWRDKQER